MNTEKLLFHFATVTFYCFLAYVLGQMQHEAAIPQLIEVHIKAHSDFRFVPSLLWKYVT